MDRPSHTFSEASLKRNDFIPGAKFYIPNNDFEVDSNNCSSSYTPAYFDVDSIASNVETSNVVNQPSNVENEMPETITIDAVADDDSVNTQNDTHDMQARQSRSRVKTKIVTTIKRDTSGPKSYGRYFIAAEIKKEIAAILIDTGAELSLCPESLKHLGKIKKLSQPFKLKGFNGKGQCMAYEKTEMKLMFGQQSYKMTFFVCNTTTLLLGSDILRNKKTKVSINTATNKIKIKDQAYDMDKNAEDA